MKRSKLRPGRKCKPCNGSGCEECKGKGFLNPVRNNRKRLKPVSSKRHELNLLYGKKRKAFMLSNPRCKILGLSGSNCNKPAVDCHHRKGRGVNFLDETTYWPVCRECHEFIHTRGKGWARSMGYIVSPTKKGEIEKPSTTFIPYGQEEANTDAEI